MDEIRYGCWLRSELCCTVLAAENQGQNYGPIISGFAVLNAKAKLVRAIANLIRRAAFRCILMPKIRLYVGIHLLARANAGDAGYGDGLAEWPERKER